MKKEWNKKLVAIGIGIASLLGIFTIAQTQMTPVYLGQGCTTAFHMDKDCDGYGVGTYANDPHPLLGSDADDNDAAVHDASQAIAKWGTLASFFAHLGYAPSRYWVLDPGIADNSTCAANADPALATACKTFAYIRPSLLPDDMVLFRTGAYPAIADLASGSAGNPIVYKAYPGELPVIDSTNDRIYTVNRSWFVIDGLKIDNSAPNPLGTGISGSTYYGNPAQCLNGTGDPGACYAGSGCVSCPSLYHDIALRNLEIVHSYWGINSSNGLLNWTLEDSVIHNDTLASEHNVYLGGREVPSENVVVRRNIFYNAGTSGNAWKFNGRCANCVLDGNIAHSSYGVGYDFENGWNHSLVTNNLSFNHSNGVMKIYNYDPNTTSHTCGNPNFICPHDQNYNTFEHNTLWLGTTSPGGSNISQTAFLIFHNNTAQSTTAGDLGHNTFRNNIFVSALNSHYPVINYEPGRLALAESELASDTWIDNIFYSSVSGNTAVVGKGEPGAGYGYTSYDCEQFAVFSTVSGCKNVNPLFADVSPAYYNAPENFDFRLQATSSAINAGSVVGTLVADIRALVRQGLPDIGAYEYELPSEETDVMPPSVPTGLSVQ